MSISKLIDNLYEMQKTASIEKTAGVGWDVHGYKKDDLDNFYKALESKDKASAEAEEYAKTQGTDPHSIRYPSSPGSLYAPENLTLSTKDKVKGAIISPVLGAGAGAYASAVSKVGKPGAFILPGALAGLGLFTAYSVNKDVKYKKDLDNYTAKKQNHDNKLSEYNNEIAKNKEGLRKYWKAHDEYLKNHYGDDMLDIVSEEAETPYNKRIKTEHDNNTNYKLNSHLMDNYGNSAHYDLLTDECYGDTPDVKNLSVKDIEKFKQQYVAAADQARQENFYGKDDKYFEPGVAAFTKKIDALKAKGADTFRLEYE